jgi:hypothetical protein
MASDYEPKHRGPVEPEVCARCRARMGVAWVDYVVRLGADTESSAPAATRSRMPN